MRNARFWVLENCGPVKITLRPGQSLSRRVGGPCDEGYSYSYSRWIHAGDFVRYETYNTASDCDGRHESFLDGDCPLDDLQSRTVEGDDMLWPAWSTGESSQRDYAAEAMGY